jgi:hypothetical protein
MAKDKTAQKGNNLVDPEMKALFIIHRDKYSVLKAKLETASGTLRAYVKTIKSDGFKLQMVKDSILLSTPEGEAEFKADIANRLLAAAYSDASVGDQLGLFLDAPEMPSVDRAYKEGQSDAMANKTANPVYAPDTEQAQRYMLGYHEEQERQVKKGIKKLDTGEDAAPKKRGRPAGKKESPNAEPPEGSERSLIAKAEKEAKAAEKAAERDAKPPRKPVEPITRASLQGRKTAAKEDAKAVADSYFSKSTDTAGNA